MKILSEIVLPKDQQPNATCTSCFFACNYSFANRVKHINVTMLVWYYLSRCPEVFSKKLS